MITYSLCVCVCVFVTVFADAALAHRDVNTTSGPVRGYLGQSGVYEFLDIPYATAPVGPNKFGPPLPPPTWQEIRDAVDRGITCLQPVLPFMNFENKTMNEDCLVASVFAPDTDQEKLPVVVYVHGGAFQVGDGNSLRPYDLVRDHNIIGVTFNYRLGAYGFLCLGTEDIPGNAGMKDQVALLRWVQKNIESFGGNPDDVTIAGFSAGSAAVDLLMLSKSAEGLFNKVIPESGANIAGFTIQSDPLESAKWFAQSLGFENVDDINALEQFYKTATFEQLTSDLSFLERPNATLPFSPCVEHPLSTERDQQEVFLDQSPRDILQSGNYKKVPLLYGFTEMEGLMFIDSFDTWKTLMNEKFSDVLPADLIFESEEEKETIAQKVKEFYFGEGPLGNDSVLRFIDYYTDIMFTYPTLRSARIQYENGHQEIYMYEFNYVDEQSTLVPYTDGIRGADHVDQTIAVFGGQLPDGGNRNMTEEYTRLTTTIQQLWANFIKTGKPVIEGSDLPSWLAVSSNWTPHMSIGNEIELRGSLLLDRALFWEDIYSKHYREPVPPLSVELEENSAGRSSAWMGYVVILLAVFLGAI